jgi:hypothetical protein
MCLHNKKHIQIASFTATKQYQEHAEPSTGHYKHQEMMPSHENVSRISSLFLVHVRHSRIFEDLLNIDYMYKILQNLSKALIFIIMLDDSEQPFMECGCAHGPSNLCMLGFSTQTDLC